jgi:hypothetical protein
MSAAATRDVARAIEGRLAETARAHASADEAWPNAATRACGRCRACGRGYTWSSRAHPPDAASRRCPFDHTILSRSVATARCRGWWVYAEAEAVAVSESRAAMARNRATVLRRRAERGER